MPASCRPALAGPGSAAIFRIVERAAIAVLGKATLLIDLLAERAGEPASLSALADAAGLPPGTAGRLLKDLVALGWADQDANRGGYRLGPRARGLGLAQRHRERFFAAARPLLAALAERLGACVQVACLRGRRRCVLHEWRPAGIDRPPVLEEHDDLWSTSSGRLLVALAPTAERRALLTELPAPDPADWPGIDGAADLHDELAWIRRRNLATRPAPRRGDPSAAVGVPDGEGGRLAVGFYVPPGGLDAARIAALQEAGRDLAARLAPDSPAAET